MWDHPKEELYTRESTTVWSIGGKTHKCFTLANKVLQSLRCTFHTNPSRPTILATPVPEEPGGEALPSICIRDREVLRVFTEQGQDFNVALQFAVRKCWASKFGLLVERVAQADGEEGVGPPVLFCLLHPLDDFTRVIVKQGGRLSEWTDQSNSIIYTSTEPSMAVTYNSLTEQHSVWRVRRATQPESEKSLFLSPESGSGTSSSHPSGTSAMTGSFTPSSGQSSIRGMASHSPSLALTPGRIHTSAMSPSHSRSVITPGHSRPSTPSHSRAHSPMFMASRSGSPLTNMASILRGGQSPSLSSKVAARFSSPTRSPTCKSGQEADSSIYEDKPLPLEVTMCFDHLWTEPGGQIKENGGKAAKVFLATDTVGQNMICFLCSGSQPSLAMVKMEVANDCATKIIFGAVRKIPAVDAVPIKGLNMVLVLDLMGSLVLYSGTTRVSKVFLPSSPTTLLSQEISALALDSGPATPFLNLDSAPSTPFNHKRSSLLTSSRPPSATLPNFGNHDSSLGFLSPVPTDHSSPITQLRDPLSLSCTISYSNSKFLTLSLPSIAGPLVFKALSAVKLLLPRELSVLLHSTWYSARHAPGPCPAPGKEWDMFCRTLLGLAGYQVDLLDLSTTSQGDTSTSSQPFIPAKKCRQSDGGCDGDWQQILMSAHHREVGDKLSRLLGLEHPVPGVNTGVDGGVVGGEVNSSAPLFPYIPAILWSLHLTYEESKLDSSLYSHLPHLASLLSKLAADLQLPQYQHHYWQDLPQASVSPSSSRQSQLTQSLLSKLSPAPQMTPTPPSIISHLTSISCSLPVEPYPLLSMVTTSSQILSTCVSLLSGSSLHSLDKVLRPLPQPGRPQTILPPLPPSCVPAHSVAVILSSNGWDKTRLSSLPPAVSVPLLSALSQCQISPPPSWPPATYMLIEREDLAHPAPRPPPYKVREVECPDGLEGLESEVSRLRWPKDQRLQEARRLLQSSRPVTVAVIQRPEVSDHDFMEEQEHFLKRLCERTMALPVGRGVASLRTTTALPTETLDIPKLCLAGKAPPRGAKVELSHIDVSQNMEHWPAFHNGVAAGLRLSTSPDSQDIDSTWICFNKPKTTDNNAQTEHAGFLMALGLNGHLAKLGKLESFDYLMKGSEPISIGLLLGMSATRRGSMDVLITKKLATQLEALLPPTATELPLSHNTQVAALMGLGLLYSDTGHRRMVEVCLKELGRPPGPELENCVDRESYSLTAGLALGMITMGKGEQLVSGGLADLSLPSVLHNHMAGGPRPAPTSSSRERPPSYQIKEGDAINIDVTSPGATLALGMMYWRSNNSSVASWMAAPETSFLLEFVRPDFLMLRTVAKGLILWDSITPSLAWLESHVPPSILPHCLVRPPDSPPPGQEHLDYETINQAYCNILAGASFVLALRFAGTWNSSCISVLSQITRKLIAVSKRSLADLTGKAVIEQALCVLVLSQGLVMAGSGDLSVLRTCRMLRARVHNNTIVTYGSHMAVHLAMGLLFMGGGKLGLSNSPSSIAALICAFFPKFPTHSSDNRYHLQALRHLYVLAVEPRVLVPRCSETGRIVKCALNLQYADTPQYRGIQLEMAAPILLPSLSLLNSVAVSDTGFWCTVFSAGDQAGWGALTSILQQGGDMPVKKKVGAGMGQSLQWGLGRDQIAKLSATPQCSTYISLFLSGCPPSWVSTLQCLLSSCLAHSAPSLLPVWTSLLSPQVSLDTAQSSLVAKQIQTLITMTRNTQANFLHPELAISLSQRTTLTLAKSSRSPDHSLGLALSQYLTCQPPTLPSASSRQLLASALTLHSLPSPEMTTKPLLPTNPMKLARLLKNSSNPASLYKIIQ